MAPRKTSTIKNKFAAPKRSQEDGVVKRRKTKSESGTPISKQVTGSGVKGMQDRGKNANKKKKKVYTEAELGIPKLNSIVPAGAVKPKGVKKGKVFVDDPESMRTILALVQADKEGQIESKMIKARQMEEIREARKAEAEKKEAERRGKLDDVKDSLRKKRKGAKDTGDKEEKKMKVWESAAGTKAAKTPKKKKSVSFA